MNKKKIALLTMMLLIALNGCAGPGNSGKSLYEHGLDIIALMEEMVGSSSYGNLMSDAADIEQMRQTPSFFVLRYISDNAAAARPLPRYSSSPWQALHIPVSG